MVSYLFTIAKILSKVSLTPPRVLVPRVQQNQFSFNFLRAGIEACLFLFEIAAASDRFFQWERVITNWSLCDS